MDVFFKITAYIFFALLATKVAIHIYLDNQNGNKVVVSPISTWVYLMPYDKAVSGEFETKKRVCNLLQKLSIYFLFFTIVVLLIRAI